MAQHEKVDNIGVNPNAYHLIEIGYSSLKMEDFIKICERLKNKSAELLSSTTNNFSSGNLQTITVTNIYNDPKEVINFIKD